MANRKTVLWETHKDSGTKMTTVLDWEVPCSFGEVEKEVQTVRSHAGLFDLGYNGLMRVSGREAVQFLQGLLTNDVKSLERGKGMRTGFLTGHGKIRALAIVLGLGQEFLIINDPQTHEKVFQYVFPFSYAGDFVVEDISAEYQTLSLQGPNSHLVMKEACFEPIPELAEYEWAENVIAGHKSLVVRRSHTGEPGYDILVPTVGVKDVWDFLLMKGKFHSLTPAGQSALDILRIEAGIPVYGVDLDENNMMLESGLDDAVSFTKGCYTGQEAVAMATYRGHVSKRFSAMVFNEEVLIEKGDKVMSGEKEVGVLTSVAWSPSFKKVIGLGCIKYGFFAEGTEVQVMTKQGEVNGEVIKLPLNK